MLLSLLDQLLNKYCLFFFYTFIIKNLILLVNFIHTQKLVFVNVVKLLAFLNKCRYTYRTYNVSFMVYNTKSCWHEKWFLFYLRKWSIYQNSLISNITSIYIKKIYYMHFNLHIIHIRITRSFQKKKKIFMPN